MVFLDDFREGASQQRQETVKTFKLENAIESSRISHMETPRSNRNMQSMHMIELPKTV
jgi:hypothetical protein